MRTYWTTYRKSVTVKKMKDPFVRVKYVQQSSEVVDKEVVDNEVVDKIP